ncbi:hypothetical protein CNMCM8980_010374 [Aspergillus fumigatiaffinis]|jgi:hypothetical protein|uniref:Uncharacterized protein n=1 Tax=Aspergillus fumigatiaffinis TaxID=340414 RepID=A0A8H4HG51_9EURO|nr:hypothetical protein CNMCM5878_008914 [Aspergillus fumigatiaffinis]KAF4243961.1 hypothetical protein CNMCM8980_010374 [Aspergillus fumigatiaffinis]KAF4245392.1 hypothetical protein CNMCM6805_005542 [Aspergillus fumigatiaffinis]
MYSQALERLHHVAAYLTPSIDTISSTTGTLVELAKHSIPCLTALKLHDLPREITAYITQEPLRLASICLFAFPEAVISPILYLTGFGSLGPIAHSLAAWYQASFGNPVAGGAFAHFQSAAMGGYGLGVLNTALRGVVGVATGVQMALGKGNGTLAA